MKKATFATRETWTDQWGHAHAITDGYPTPAGYVTRFSKVCQTVIAKYALIGWAARTERERILSLLDEEPMTRPMLTAALIERNGAYKNGQPKLTHEVVRDEAGGIGTEAHAWLEWWVSGQHGPEPAAESDGARIAQRVMRPWLEQAGFRYRYVEQAVYLLPGELPPCGMGGRLDWAAETDGCEVTDHRGTQGRVPPGFFLGDWKTGSGVYVDHLLQTAFYAKALSVREGTPWPCPVVIVHVPKTEADARKWGEKPEVYLVSPERVARLWVGVRAMLNLYELIQEGV